MLMVMGTAAHKLSNRELFEDGGIRSLPKKNDGGTNSKPGRVNNS